ncbi:phage Gp37/Gp68 family protein [Methylorubrum extorquens]|uniref:phage Gp37/Gp68 family protein n=1 Tax=Methylorubrum extorquens TaxID=408 RepID=UPI0022373F45|nr:phage Gp37/Gp68 family protein [Methylorubrum extorquens]UYW25724.1 phage Gp37/Gp68 family protein [Methylorubrum extorquens]
MSEHSTIEWTDATWNPVTGCSVVSPGCTNCYAMGLAGTRLQHHPSRAGLTRPSKAGPVWNGEVRLNEGWLTQPLQWKRPRMIFVCAHGDLFHESVPDAWIDRVFAVMARCGHHTFQVLTKRSARMRAYLSGLPDRMRTLDCDSGLDFCTLPLPNVWLGVSAEDQRRADERVPDLLATPAAVRFVSAEPLLGPINFTQISLGMKPGYVLGENGRPDRPETFKVVRDALMDTGGDFERIDWIVVGGESGPNARPMHPAWARSIRDQCAAAGVAFHFKQWGAWQPREWCRDGGTHAMRDRGGYESFQQIQSHPNSIERVGAGPEWSAFALVGKKAAGRLLDAVEHNGMPVTGGARG